MNTKNTVLTGPIEENSWPEALTGHVVTPGFAPRVHGYDVESDLARHYHFAETVLLTLTGQPPNASVGKAFEVALAFLLPLAVSEAPTHAAVLAKLMGSRTVVSVGAIVLTERARYLLDRHAELLAWLDNGCEELPERYTATDPDEQAAVERLRLALQPTGMDLPIFAKQPTRTAACLAVLHACGLRQSEQFETALVLAALPCVVAEALATRPGNFREYPIDLPAFRYEEP